MTGLAFSVALQDPLQLLVLLGPGRTTAITELATGTQTLGSFLAPLPKVPHLPKTPVSGTATQVPKPVPR